DELLSGILSGLDALGSAPSSSRPIGFRPPSGAPQGSGAQTMKPTWPGPRPMASDTTASSEDSAALERRRSRGARTATRPGVLRTAVGRASQSRSVVPPPAREERKMSTLTARIPRRTQLRKETPFAQVLESFFIHNGMAPKTKDFYRGNFNAMASGSDRASNEPTLADLNADYVSAFLRDLEVTPTKRYPQGSPFRSRAACKS